MNRSAHSSSAAARSNPPALRHEARTTSPTRSSAPTTAGRPRRSASRDATSPTIPTGHGPWTRIAGPARSRRLGRDCRGTSASASHVVSVVSVASREVRRRRASPASAVGLGRVVGQQERAPRRAASPTRPAALIRGAMANATVSRSAVGRRDRPRARRSAAMPAAAPRRIRSRPEPRDGPVLAEDRRDVRDRPDRGEVGQVQRPPPGRPARSTSSSWASLNATPLPARRRSG